MVLYVQPHVTQFDGDKRQGSACVPASLANGVGATTGGARRPAAGVIHALVAPHEEASPAPGWNTEDADLAMQRYGMAFHPVEGWAALKEAHDAGHYIIVQGDSDRFSNSTCSGAFDGLHCIGAHPKETTINGKVAWWIDDPICKTGRWELEERIRVYADALPTPTIRGGIFDSKVPAVPVAPPNPPTVVLRFGGHKLTPRQTKRIHVPAGRRANIRKRPDRLQARDIVGNLANGRTFVAYQRTVTGVLLAGSRVWYGDQTGTRWLHSSSF